MAAATMYVTVAGAGTKAGDDWDNAMGQAEFVADYASGAEAGDIYYVMSGTYTLSASLWTDRDGAIGSYISIIGVSDEALSEAQDDDRPLFAMGTSYSMYADNYWNFRNLRGTGNQAYIFRLDHGGIFVNCKAVNTSGDAGRSGIYTVGVYNNIINCESSCTNGWAFYSRLACNIYGCYAYNSVVGIGSWTGNVGSFAINNIIDTCTTGIDVNGGQSCYSGNTIYNCTTGIDIAASLINIYLNNAIDSCTTGISAAATLPEGNIFDYNNYSNSGSDDVVNVTKGDNATANAPVFTDAPNGDFSQTGLNNNGFPAEFPAGLTTSYPAQGAVVSKVTAGGGGSYGFVG